MYLKQMGQVPLLTREQEVEISKRIETAENHVREIINNLGITAREHVALAQRLQSGRERFDRVILDKKIDSREQYMRVLPRLLTLHGIGQLGGREKPDVFASAGIHPRRHLPGDVPGGRRSTFGVAGVWTERTR